MSFVETPVLGVDFRFPPPPSRDGKDGDMSSKLTTDGGRTSHEVLSRKATWLHSCAVVSKDPCVKCLPPTPYLWEVQNGKR